MKNNKYYCGPSYLPNWIREKLSKRFNTQCKLHDEHYTDAKHSRKRADDIFLKGMLSSSKNRKDRIIARTWYGVVRLFGWTRYGKD